MYKYVIQLVLGAMVCLLVGLDTAGASPKAIFLDDGDVRTETRFRTAETDGETYLPTEFIRGEVYGNTTTDSDNRQMRMRFGMPRVATGERELDRLLFSAVTLSLPYRVIDGQSYVSVPLASRLLGFVYDDTETFTVHTGKYTSFAPYVLPETGPRPELGERKIRLAWQPTFEPENNLAVLEKHEGLNVVSPSWFAIVDEQGLVTNKVDPRYVEEAHKKGYQVWALITNSFDPELTSSVLANDRARKNVVKQLVIYTRLYGLDGINLDFENVYDADRNRLTAFVGELTAALHAVGAKVSIDFTVPSNVSQWSTCYDRKAIGDLVDYVMVMAYDEYWRTSPVSGSVASIGWVERGVINTLKEVPAEKVVLGVPFYMREWEENFSGQKTGVKTMTMDGAQKTIEKRGLTPVWLEDQGQYYFEYRQGNRRYRVWQEEERSMALKAGLVQKYNLAGIAAWRKGFETPEIWRVIEEQIGETVEISETNVENTDNVERKEI